MIILISQIKLKEIMATNCALELRQMETSITKNAMTMLNVSYVPLLISAKDPPIVLPEGLRNVRYTIHTYHRRIRWAL